MYTQQLAWVARHSELPGRSRCGPSVRAPRRARRPLAKVVYVAYVPGHADPWPILWLPHVTDAALPHCSYAPLAVRPGRLQAGGHQAWDAMQRATRHQAACAVVCFWRVRMRGTRACAATSLVAALPARRCYKGKGGKPIAPGGQAPGPNSSMRSGS